MGFGYTLVNIDRRERIGFLQVDTGTKLRELAGTVIASTIIAFYLLTRKGDRIGFVDDTENSFVVCGERYEAGYFTDFVDVTNDVIEELIEQKIVKDCGIVWIDESDSLFYRKLVNAWDPALGND